VTTTPTIEIKRHFQTLSEKETEELVGLVADMLVTFIKNRRSGRCGNAPPSFESPKESEAQHTGDNHGPIKSE